MNVFEWVGNLCQELNAAGQVDLARSLWTFDELIHEDEIEPVESTYRELLAAARAMEHGWLEVYVQFWYLQHRLTTLQHGEAALNQAIDALEFAHQPANAGCPQAVCLVQQLCIAYGNVDRYGYATDRQAAAIEALAGIDAERTCFDCISREHGRALFDRGEHNSALEVLDQACEAMVAAGEDPSTQVDHLRLEILIEQGDYETAFEVLDRADRAAQKNGVRRHARLCQTFRAELLARTGRAAEAVQYQVPVEVPLRILSAAPRWIATTHLLANAGAVENDWRLGRDLGLMTQRLEAAGAWLDAVEAGVHAARLAIARGARWVAATETDLVERCIAKLRSQREWPQTVRELRSEIEALGNRVSHPDATASPELILDDDNASVEDRAGALAEIGRSGQLFDWLWGLDTTDPAVLADHVLTVGGYEQLERFTATFESSAPAICALLTAGLARRNGDRAQFLTSLEHCLDMLGDTAEEISIPPMWTTSRQVLAAELALGAATLGRATPLPPQIESSLAGLDDAEFFPVVFEDQTRYFAQRNGELTAVVVEIAPPGSPQHVGDLVVFDPRSITEWVDDTTPAYAVYEVVTPGGFVSWQFDGPKPSDPQWEAFSEWIEAVGWRANQWSDEGYQVTDLEGDPVGKLVPGVNGVIAVPAEVEVDEIWAALASQFSSWEFPLVLLRLAEQVSDREVLTAQRSLRKRFAL